MLRRSHTATIEQNETYTENFDTEPYECGWASEVTWFVRVINLAEGSSMKFIPQISPDGLFWCDKEGTEPVHITEEKLYACELNNFGSWLRLRCVLDGEKPQIKIMVHLALKE